MFQVVLPTLIEPWISELNSCRENRESEREREREKERKRERERGGRRNCAVRVDTFRAHTQSVLSRGRKWRHFRLNQPDFPRSPAQATGLFSKAGNYVKNNPAGWQSLAMHDDQNEFFRPIHIQIWSKLWIAGIKKLEEVVRAVSRFLSINQYRPINNNIFNK